MGISVRAVARAPGRATITALAMPLGGPDAHAGHKDILAYPVLKDTIVIEVSPKIGNECDKPILLPPHGNAQLRVDSRFAQGHEMKYSLMHPSQGSGCGDIVRSVGKDGQVKVGESLGHCHVHIASSHSNQATSRHIVVDRVALLVTGPHREGDTVMDVKQRMEFHITPKDSHGNEFSDTSRIRVDFEVAPAGIVRLRIENLTLHVTAERPGKAVVRIFLEEDHKVQDFFEVHVRDTSASTRSQSTVSSNAYQVKVYADKPVSHRIPLEPTWYRVEFLQNKEPGTAEIKQVRFQCSILEGQWASAQPHTTSTANYCIVTPIIPTSPTDVVPSLTLVIDSNELQVHHTQTIALTPTFTVLGAQTDRKFAISQTPQTVTLVSPTPHTKVESSNALRVRPASSQRPMGSGYVTEYLVELANGPSSNPQALNDEDLYVRFIEEGKGADKQQVRINFAVEEGTNYLLIILCTLLVLVLTFILGGIPCRTFPRAVPKRTLPTTPAPASPLPSAISTPISPLPTAPLDLPSFIPSIHPVTPIPPYPTSSVPQSPYGATPTYSPRSPVSPHTPSSATPSRFLINTNQNFYDSQRLRGPKF